MRGALLALLALTTGCAVCRTPAAVPLTTPVEQRAHLDAALPASPLPLALTPECITLDLRPSAALVLQVVADCLRLALEVSGAERRR